MTIMKKIRGHIFLFALNGPSYKGDNISNLSLAKIYILKFNYQDLNCCNNMTCF